MHEVLVAMHTTGTGHRDVKGRLQGEAVEAEDGRGRWA